MRESLPAPRWSQRQGLCECRRRVDEFNGTRCVFRVGGWWGGCVACVRGPGPDRRGVDHVISSHVLHHDHDHYMFLVFSIFTFLALSSHRYSYSSSSYSVIPSAFCSSSRQ